MPPLFPTLEQRGFVFQASEGLPEHLDSGRRTIYVGFDPTADSLHLGNLVPILGLRRFQQAGHRVIAVVGGATGMIGDPSGKSEERQLLSVEAIARNVEGVKRDLSRFLDFSGDNPALLVNNYDWISKMSIIEYLRDVGKHFSINVMMAKDSVKRRIGGENTEGMSFTEFSYMTLQAYDFGHLHAEHGCTIQAGGSDQWGNITAGIDFIHKTRGAQAYALTFPLLTTASGEKFGKSAGNAVWLSPDKTSAYQFYQYWLNTDDRDIERYLKLFTFLPLEQIAQAVGEHAKAPERREGQKLLAGEITRMVHGEGALERATSASQALFKGDVRNLGESELREVFADAPSTKFTPAAIAGGIAIHELLVQTGITKSKGEAKRLVQGGGVYVNDRQMNDIETKLASGDLIAEKFLILRVGKKRYHLVSFE